MAMTSSDTGLRDALKSQYHAALAMLRQAIERCPEDLWLSAGEHPIAYWHVAYHTLFYTHFYLQPDHESFVPWAKHRAEYNFMTEVPWSPDERPKIGAAYTKAEVLEYWHACDGMVDDALDRLDLASPESGFPWYPISKPEHQIVNIRHIQHHTAALADRLRVATDGGIDWVGAGSGSMT
jgi:hypothetical protein